MPHPSAAKGLIGLRTLPILSQEPWVVGMLARQNQSLYRAKHALLFERVLLFNLRDMIWATSGYEDLK